MSAGRAFYFFMAWGILRSTLPLPSITTWHPVAATKKSPLSIQTGLRKTVTLYYATAPWPSLHAARLQRGAIKRVSALPVSINRQSQPEFLKARDPRFTQIGEYLAKITASENLNGAFAVEGNEFLIAG